MRPWHGEVPEHANDPAMTMALPSCEKPRLRYFLNSILIPSDAMWKRQLSHVLDTEQHVVEISCNVARCKLLTMVSFEHAREETLFTLWKGVLFLTQKFTVCIKLKLGELISMKSDWQLKEFEGSMALNSSPGVCGPWCLQTRYTPVRRQKTTQHSQNTWKPKWVNLLRCNVNKHRKKPKSGMPD